MIHNYIAPYAPIHFLELSAEQKLVTACKPGTRMPQIAPEDVGKFGSAAFVHPERYSGKEIELGNENLTLTEVSEIISRVADVDVKVKHRNSEEIEGASFKVPTQQFHIMANEQDMIIDPGALKEYRIEFTCLGEYLIKEKVALKKALGLNI
jgi:hypothetical protein